MTEKTAFEERLAAELEHRAGAPRPIDAASIRRQAQARQPRRWWNASLVERLRTDVLGRSASGTTDETGEYAPAPTGRTRMMFSATKLIAGSAVLAVTATLVVSGVFTTDPVGPIPGAELERTDFIVVTGTSTMSAGPSPAGDDSMSDPRVSGHANLINRYLIGDEDLTGVNWGQYTLANDGGSWEGEWVGFYESPGDDDDYGTPGAQNAMAWASGTGDYEGWSYVANYTGRLLGLEVKGLLYQGEIPPTVALGLLGETAD